MESIEIIDATLDNKLTENDDGDIEMEYFNNVMGIGLTNHFISCALWEQGKIKHICANSSIKLICYICKRNELTLVNNDSQI